MFEVTEKAIGMIKEFLQNSQGGGAVRVLLQSGCCGSSLGLALDEQKETDQIFQEQGITFAIDTDLLEKAKPIRLDFIEAGERSGFKFTSGLPASGGCCG
jgi:iron-sulfur cluster assembly accessory protein